MAGYAATRKIITASSYLTSKYLTGDFDIIFLNTGDFSGKLYSGRYEDLGQIGPTPQEWLVALTEYLSNLDDKLIIWGSDDFFLSKPIKTKAYISLLNKIKSEENIVCAKLCNSLFHNKSEYDSIEDDMFLLNNTAEYSAVVQFCIWRREFLITMLRQANSPWDFERDGSQRLNATGKKVIGTFDCALKYPTRTATSGTHPGKVSVLGNKNEDIEFLIENGHLNKDDLIMGLWPGDVKTYEESGGDHYTCLEGCGDKEYNKRELDICLN